VTLNGAAGDDTFLGSAGSDNLDGGQGADMVRAAADVNFTLTNSSLVGLGTDALNGIESASLAGGNSANQIDASAFTLGPVTLQGGMGNDTLIGSTNSADVLFENGDVDFTLTNTNLTGQGTDTLSGLERAWLVGGLDADQINASAFTLGPVTLQGGGGNDTLTGSASAADVLFEEGNVDFTLTSAFLTGQGTDSHSGLERASLVGGSGDNSFFVSGWSQQATLDGGGGDDRVVSSGNANFTLTDTTLTRSTGGSFTLLSIESARLTGGNSSNTFDASGFSGRVTMTGSFGNDTFKGGSGEDTIVESFNTNFEFFNSFFFGQELRNGFFETDSLSSIEGLELAGGSGNNTLDVSKFSGNATLTGGLGNDTLIGGTGVTRIVEAGDVSFTLTDTSLTGLGADTLTNVQEAFLTGGASANTFTLNGWSGSANLTGLGLGDSVIVTGDTHYTLTDALIQRVGFGDIALENIASATLTGGAGVNIFDVTGWSGTGSLDGGASGQDHVIAGGNANFTLTNSLLGLSSGPSFNLAGIDVARLTAGSGDDDLNASAFTGIVILAGGTGNDTLRAGTGPAELDGGDGDDLYVIQDSPSVSLTDSSGIDSIDFAAVTHGIFIDLTVPANGVQLLTNEGSEIGVLGLYEHVVGTAFADWIVGNDFANNLQGLGGNDTLLGGAGDDTLDGGTGGDELLGAAGDDLLMGQDGDDYLDGADGNDTLLGGNSNDFLTGGSGSDSVAAGSGNDFYGVEFVPGAESGDDIVDLGGDDDVATDLTGWNTLMGGTGGDLLIAGAGHDSLDGGDDDDTLTGGNGDDTITGGFGTDRVDEEADANFTLTNASLTGVGSDLLALVEQAQLTGGANANDLNASAFLLGSVTLIGGGGNDTLTGGNGDDELIGGLGDDSLNGGAGTNRVFDAGDVSFTLTNATLTGMGSDSLTNIQEAHLVGGIGNNTLDASAFSGSVTLEGGAGNDSLIGGASDDVLTGGEGNDTLTGGAGANTAFEFGDVHFALTNTQLTGLGTDSLTNIQRAHLSAGPGGRTLDASAFTLGPVTLVGGAGNDTLIGTAADDELSGGLGNDSINGAGGTDTLVEFGDVNMTLTNTTLSGLGSDSLSSVERARLTGGAGNNNINAAAFTLGSVTLIGEAGDDTLVGGTGDDSLDGGDGFDTLDGGPGTDVGVNGEVLFNIP